jgi:predicted secreted protein
MNPTATAVLSLALIQWPALGMSAEFDLVTQTAEQGEVAEVQLEVSVERAVEHDTVQAVLTVESEDRDLARVADSIKQTLNWAMDAAKESPFVKTTSGPYRTYPIYDRYDPYRFSHWRGVQELFLESTEFRALDETLSRLQGKLLVKSVMYSLSAQERIRAEDAAVEEALKAFTARAELVQKTLKGNGYRIADLEISTDGAQQPQEGGPMSPPGPSQPAKEFIRSSIRGTIELQ